MSGSSWRGGVKAAFSSSIKCDTKAREIALNQDYMVWELTAESEVLQVHKGADREGTKGPALPWPSPCPRAQLGFASSHLLLHLLAQSKTLLHSRLTELTQSSVSNPGVSTSR